MTDTEAFSRACVVLREHGDDALAFVATRIEASFTEGDDDETKVWLSVGLTIHQIDSIACCRFAGPSTFTS